MKNKIIPRIWLFFSITFLVTVVIYKYNDARNTPRIERKISAESNDKNVFNKTLTLAQHGDAVEQANMGMFYGVGWYVSQDHKEALKCF